MKVVGIQILKEFTARHADVAKQIAAWLREVEEACWQSHHDLTKRYSSASILTQGRVVFNLKGKKYRLYVKVSYKTQVVLIKNIGTHAEYSKWHLEGG